MSRPKSKQIPTKQLNLNRHIVPSASIAINLFELILEIQNSKFICTANYERETGNFGIWQLASFDLPILYACNGNYSWLEVFIVTVSTLYHWDMSEQHFIWIYNSCQNDRASTTINTVIELQFICSTAANHYFNVMNHKRSNNCEPSILKRKLRSSKAKS